MADDIRDAACHVQQKAITVRLRAKDDYFESSFYKLMNKGHGEIMVG